MMVIRCTYIALGVTFSALALSSPAKASPLLRYPDIHGEQVVFTQGGDLWTAAKSGGVARRITSHPGLELFAKFSPDGRWIAFTGQYDGAEHVYVVPSQGGVPRRLTFYPSTGPLPARWGFDHQVYGWTPDGQNIVFRSQRDRWRGGRLYTVPVKGGLPSVLPPPEAGSGVFSPDGKKLFYSPLFRDFRTWKRYAGGWAQDLYVFDLASKKIRNITDHPRTDRDPMWIGGALYFASDRDDRLNLYTFNLSENKLTQLTHHKEADVRWPSESPDGAIVYELSGQLRVFDSRTRRDTPIKIQVPTDQVASRPRYVSVADRVETFALAPDGKRVAFVARGDVFDLPVEEGISRNWTSSSYAHDREVQWSPDGKSIVYISDEKGEEELWRIDRGSGQKERLSKGGQGRLYRPLWSPDARYVVFGDKEGGIYIYDVDRGKQRLVAEEPGYGRPDWVWSPRGGYLAFSLEEKSGHRSVHIYDVSKKKLHRASAEHFHAFSPAWGTEGKYLYYLSHRSFRPQFAAFDYNYVGAEETGIYALALKRETDHPFAVPSDRPPVQEKKEKKKKEKKNKKKKASDDASQKKGPLSIEQIRELGSVEIDFEGLSHRVTRVPIKADDFRSLTTAQGRLIFFDEGPSFFGEKRTLLSYELKKKKKSVLASDVKAFSVASSGRHVLVQTSKGYELLEPGKPEKKQVSTKSLYTRIVPSEEWVTIFNEVWRRFRDYFYVENMHGFDWKAIGERYRKQLPGIAHREELNDLIGQMIAELEVSHAYISGGDLGLPKRPYVALPGVRFELDAKAKRYRIAKIFAGHNEEAKYRSPLTEVGVAAKLGEYILEVNGRPLLASENPYEALTLPAGAPVELLLADKPGKKGRRVVYQPIASENALLYLEFVLDKRERVAKATDGKVGYIHLPDMGVNGLSEFTKWFYSQVHKDGLIVDVRGNGGGFVSQMIIDRLSRRVLGSGFSRTSSYRSIYPYGALTGPMVCLMNADSASDGDIFPWAFRASGLGPLIGKRSWGGVVGITDHGSLLDGGQVFVPEFSTNGADGEYIIEGHGVDPDIVVDNPPKAVLDGRDPQLERGVEELKKRLSTWPSPPKRPQPPVHKR